MLALSWTWCVRGPKRSDRILQPGVVHEPPGPPRALEDAPDPDIQLPEDVPGRHRVPPGVGRGIPRGSPAEGRPRNRPKPVRTSAPCSSRSSLGSSSPRRSRDAVRQRRAAPRGVPLGRQRQQPLEHPGIPDPAALDQGVEIQPVAHDLLEDLQVEGGVVGDEDPVPRGPRRRGPTASRARKNPAGRRRPSRGPAAGRSAGSRRRSAGSRCRRRTGRRRRVPGRGVHSSNGQ